MQTVAPYLSRQIQTVPADTRRDALRERFADARYRHLIVVRDGRLVGVVRSAAADAATDPDLTAEDLLSGALIVSETSRLDDALQALSDEREDIVVAMNDAGEPVGVLTEEDGVRLAQTLLTDIDLALSHATRDVVRIAPSATVGEARSRMRIGDFRHLLVSDGIAPLAVVSERDLVGQDHRTPVAELVQGRSIRTAPVDASMAEIAAVMRQQRIGCVPLTERGSVVGLVTRTDVIRALLQSVMRA